jgi:hypothetical protein
MLSVAEIERRLKATKPLSAMFGFKLTPEEVDALLTEYRRARHEIEAKGG